MAKGTEDKKEQARRRYVREDKRSSGQERSISIARSSFLKSLCDCYYTNGAKVRGIQIVSVRISLMVQRISESAHLIAALSAHRRRLKEIAI